MLKPDSSAAVEFLQRLAPGGPWTLTAIHPDRKARRSVVTASFDDATVDGLKAWLAEHNGTRNCYYALNPLRAGVENKKASKADVRELAWLHVDVDPRDGADLAAERQRIEALFSVYTTHPRPTALIFTGGGVQAIYRLAAPLPLDGDEAIVEAEQYNRALEARFGGDHCHNVDRILRLPGTINIPDAKKVARGRVSALAEVICFNDEAYALDQFEKAPALPARPALREAPTTPRQISEVSELDRWNVPDRVKVAIVQGYHPDEPKEGDNSRSAWVFDVACNLARCGVPDDVVLGVLTNAEFGISESVLEAPGGAAKYAARQLERAKETITSETPRGDDRKKSGPTARQLAQGLLDARRDPLLRFNGEWLTFDRGAYKPREEEGLRSETYRVYPRADSTLVSKVLDAVKGLVHFDRNSFSPPCWLDPRAGPDPSHLLVLRNGILDLETGTLAPHDEKFFTRNALDFDFDPDAPPPTRWLKFLGEVWPDETDCQETLQQMLGYLLTPDTSHQKIFVLVGPTRSGKGTIGHVIGRLLGRDNVCNPTLSQMAEQFGLQSLIGKQLALIPDMRLGARTDQAVVAETMLKISGEDSVNVPRKNMVDWEGRLAARLVIMSNEAPTLNDPSGALLGRYIVMQMRQSFLGREDLGLDAALMAEMPGILNWAIAGWRALRQAGHFKQPQSADMLVRAMARVSSPINTFIDERCEMDRAATVTKDALYIAFKRWAEDADHPWRGSKELFGKQLLATVGQHIHERRGRAADGSRPWQWLGLRVRAGSGYGGYNSDPDPDRDPDLGLDGPRYDPPF